MGSSTNRKQEETMPDRFVVIENTPGYLPMDDDPATFDNYDDAVAYLNERAAEYADDADGNYRVEYGIASSDNLAAVIVHDDDKMHDLGTVIQVLRDDLDDDDDDDDAPADDAPADDAPAATLEDVRMEVIPDDDHDASYLEQEGWDERRAAYQRGDFGFVGIRAAADIRIRSGEGWIRQTITSPGLWSIDDDSGADYFAEVFEEEKGVLAAMLTALGIDAAELTKPAPASDDAPAGFGLEQARGILEGTPGYEKR